MAENVVHTHAAAGEARSVEYLVCFAEREGQRFLAKHALPGSQSRNGDFRPEEGWRGEVNHLDRRNVEEIPPIRRDGSLRVCKRLPTGQIRIRNCRD
jgi:hypothetical protein